MVMSDDWSPMTPTTGFWVPVSSVKVSLAVADPAEHAANCSRFSSCILVKKPFEKSKID